jgi:hypothetical protein
MHQAAKGEVISTVELQASDEPTARSDDSAVLSVEAVAMMVASLETFFNRV